jgi:hypothetical protein
MRTGASGKRAINLSLSNDVLEAAWLPGLA